MLVLGPGPVLRARRIRHGHAPVAGAGRHGELPEFMSLYGDQTELPLIWKPFENLWVSVALALLIPMADRRRCSAGWCSRGASAGRTSPCSPRRWPLIFTLIMVGQLKTFAGTNGLTDFQTVFGRNQYDPGTNTFLYFVAAGVLVVVFLIGRHLVRSRYGRLLRRRPRPRGSGPLPRLQPGRRQDVRLRRRRRDGRRRWRGRGARDRHRRARTSSAPCRRSSWSAGSPSAAAARCTARSSAPSSSTGARPR